MMWYPHEAKPVEIGTHFCVRSPWETRALHSAFYQALRRYDPNFETNKHRWARPEAEFIPYLGRIDDMEKRLDELGPNGSYFGPHPDGWQAWGWWHQPDPLPY